MLNDTYPHISYILETKIIGLHFAANLRWNFYGGLRKIGLSARVTFRPFKVIQCHWFWYQSKAHMWLPI